MSSEAVRKAFIENPASQEIANDLNYKDTNVCKHRRNPCILRCGVRKEYLAGVDKWRVIPQAQRHRWLDGGERWIGFCDQHKCLRFVCGCEKGV